MRISERNLDFSKLSPKNSEVFPAIRNFYDLLPLDAWNKFIPRMDILQISADYKKLVSQVRETVSKLGLPDIADLKETLNSALRNPSYKKSLKILTSKLDMNNQKISGVLVPKVIDLHVIRMNLDFLNNLPGASGKPLNIFKLEDL